MIVGSMVHVGEIFSREYKDKQTKEDKTMFLMPVAVYPNFPSKVGSYPMDIMPSDDQKKEQAQGRLFGFHIMVAKPSSETAYERQRVTGISFGRAVFIPLIDTRTGINNYSVVKDGCSFQQAFSLFYSVLNANQIDAIPDPEQYLANFAANGGQATYADLGDAAAKSAKISASASGKPGMTVTPPLHP